MAASIHSDIRGAEQVLDAYPEARPGVFDVAVEHQSFLPRIKS